MAARNIPHHQEPSPLSSLSRRFHSWKNKVNNNNQDFDQDNVSHGDDEMQDGVVLVTSNSSKPEPETREKLSSTKPDNSTSFTTQRSQPPPTTGPNKGTRRAKLAISKLRSALALGTSRARTHFSSGLGTKVVGTLFGNRRGHVHFAFQEDFKLGPAFLVELATPTSILVKEMASGLVRIALECDKRRVVVEKNSKGPKLLEEPVWRTYCNGKKCGFAMKRECGPEEWKVLNAIGPISMGAGVLPGSGPDGEMMYMRAKFERVVGSKDSEAFYMMNPDGNGGPELSVYLLRV